MNRAAALLVTALLCALAASTAVGANDPREEKKRLRPLDVTLAKRTTLKLADLAPGWKRLRSSGSDSGDSSSCPGYNPDLSRFTITGEADSDFQHPEGFFIASRIQVFASRAQADADFRASAKPALARCLRLIFEREFAKSAGGSAKAVSSRMVASPRIGERAAWYRLFGHLTIRGKVSPMHMDFLAVQQGRTQAMLMFFGLNGPIRDEVALGRLLASRMR